jgi:hypothetical protein
MAKLLCKHSLYGFHYWRSVTPISHDGTLYVARCTHCKQWLSSDEAEKLLNAAARRHPSIVSMRDAVGEALAALGNDDFDKAFRILAEIAGVVMPAVDLTKLAAMAPDDFGKLREGDFSDLS